MSLQKRLVVETVKNALSSDPNFQSRWEDIVHELMSSNSANDPQAIAAQIRNSGVLDQVIRRIKQEKATTKNIVIAKIASAATPLDNGPSSSSLVDMLDHVPVLFSVRKGTGLVDYAAVESLSVSDRPAIQLVFCYANMRYTSDLYVASPDIVFPAETQFAFNIPLPKSPLKNITEYLLNAKHAISVYLLEYRMSGESWIPQLKMHGTMEWRHCLHSSTSNLPLRIDLKGVGEVAQQSLGMLEVEASLGPPVPDFCLDSDVVELHLTLEHSKKTEAERAFINYARLWHKDFIELSPVMLARRAVKLFVHDERGSVRFPPSFIKLLAASRLMDTPQQCARFVSLISAAPKELQSSSGQEQDEIWFSCEASLVSSTTTNPGRAVLLCSFFLGLGLDAYVCTGRATSTDAYEEEEVVRVWVLVIMQGAAESEGPERVVFWDPLTGSTFQVRPKSAALSNCPFRTVDCVFTVDMYLANIQPDNKIADVSFDLNNNDKWRALDVSTCPQVDVANFSANFKMLPWSNRRFANDPYALADWLEEEISRLFAEHRNNIGLPRAEMDQRLSAALGMALSSYEMASSLGPHFAMPKDFITATRNLVPHGCVLRAVPLQLPLESVSHPTRAFTSALTRCQAARDVVELPGNIIRCALRVKVVPFAEKVAAVWLMLASYSRPV